MESGAWSCTLAVSFVLLALLNASPAAAGGEGEKVLTLDRSNFTETVSKHDFIVVAFYAPWCIHSKALAPEYEKAASTLSKHEPPIILAKVDANEEANRELATEFEIYGFPTIKILRNGGKHIREYNGPREAYCFVKYLKKQVGPASAEIKSLEDATSLIDEKKIFVVGVFPKFSGEEYENFMTLAEKLRTESSHYWDINFKTDYAIAHTLDAKFLPRGEPVDKPTLRLLKPFDELFVDFQDFKVDVMEKFIEEASIPLVTVRDNDPSNHPYINKFFESSNAKAVLFVKFSKEQDSFETKYKDVATLYKEKGVSFQFADVDAGQGAFQYFGLKEEEAPLLIIQDAEGQKYLKANIEPSQIASWVKDYLDGHVKPFIRSEPIPDVNNEPVKVVVTNILQDMVFSSGNVISKLWETK